MGTSARHTPPIANLRPSSGRALEQCVGRFAGGRRYAMAPLLYAPSGVVGQPSLRETGDVIGDLDVAAFTGISRHPAGREGSSRPALPARNQSTDRARLALFAAVGRR